MLRHDDLPIKNGVFSMFFRTLNNQRVQYTHFQDSPSSNFAGPRLIVPVRLHPHDPRSCRRRYVETAGPVAYVSGKKNMGHPSMIRFWGDVHDRDWWG